jgi:hypothetical protein
MPQARSGLWPFLSDLTPAFRLSELYVSSVRINAGLQLRRAISIQAEGKRLLEKHAIAPSAARLCSVALRG